MRLRTHFDAVTQLRVKNESIDINSFLAAIILIHEERLGVC